MKVVGKLTVILLGVWLILTGLVPLLNLNIPSIELLLAILAIAVGIMLILEIKSAPTKNLGRLLLAIWLILQGIIPLINFSFSGLDLVLALLAVAAGVLLILNR